MEAGILVIKELLHPLFRRDDRFFQFCNYPTGDKYSFRFDLPA